MKTFKILGLLLTYPSEDLVAAGPDMAAILAEEAILPARQIKDISKFLKVRTGEDILDLQEEYVDTFDKGRAHCLHLFEHIHGESRDRGQAMVDLAETYESKGTFLNASELPDYLPVFLEYLSVCSLTEAAEMLGDAIHVIAMIGRKLKKRKSRYAEVFTSLEKLSAIKPDEAALKEALEASPKDPSTLDELDQQWQEAEAFSGDAKADCQSCSAISQAQQAVNRMTEGA